MNKKIDALFTSKTDDWATPLGVYNTFLQFGFYDPCPFKSNCNLFGIIPSQNRIYMNPPFSQNKLWCKFATDLYNNGKDVWMLIAVRIF